MNVIKHSNITLPLCVLPFRPNWECQECQQNHVSDIISSRMSFYT